jgi:hypothetical protein
MKLGRLVERRIVPVEDPGEMLQRYRRPPRAQPGHAARERDHADEIVQALRYRRLLGLGDEPLCDPCLTPQAMKGGARDQRAGPPPRLPDLGGEPAGLLDQHLSRSPAASGDRHPSSHHKHLREGTQPALRAQLRVAVSKNLAAAW